MNELRNLKDIPMQNETVANKATYLAIQGKNQNLGGANNAAYLILPTQLQISSYVFNAASDDNIRIIMTSKQADIGSCKFTLYSAIFDDDKNQFVPYEKINILTNGSNAYLDQNNNLLEMVNVQGPFCFVKDFSQVPVGLIIMYGTNYSDPITNIMLSGIKNQWR